MSNEDTGENEQPVHTDESEYKNRDQQTSSVPDQGSVSDSDGCSADPTFEYCGNEIQQVSNKQEDTARDTQSNKKSQEGQQGNGKQDTVQRDQEDENPNKAKTQTQTDNKCDKSPANIKKEKKTGQEQSPPTNGSSVSSEEYTFNTLPTHLLPPDVQYTPEYDEYWVYSTGHKAGAGRDDVPVQGLEIGVITHENHLVKTIQAVIQAMIKYQNATGRYPRHRIISSKVGFDEIATDSWGLVAACQPQLDTHEKLLDHLSDFQDKDYSTEIPANIETTKQFLQYLGNTLEKEDILRPNIDKIPVPASWKEGVQIEETILFERYTALGSDHLYDPELVGNSLDEKEVTSLSKLSTRPEYCSEKYSSDLDFI